MSEYENPDVLTHENLREKIGRTTWFVGNFIFTPYFRGVIEEARSKKYRRGDKEYFAFELGDLGKILRPLLERESCLYVAKMLEMVEKGRLNGSCGILCCFVADELEKMHIGPIELIEDKEHYELIVQGCRFDPYLFFANMCARNNINTKVFFDIDRDTPFEP